MHSSLGTECHSFKMLSFTTWGLKQSCVIIMGESHFRYCTTTTNTTTHYNSTNNIINEDYLHCICFKEGLGSCIKSLITTTVRYICPSIDGSDKKL